MPRDASDVDMNGGPNYKDSSSTVPLHSALFSLYYMSLFRLSLRPLLTLSQSGGERTRCPHTYIKVMVMIMGVK